MADYGPGASTIGGTPRVILSSDSPGTSGGSGGGTTPATTATLANVAGSASSVTLLALNTARLGVIIVNDSTAILYVKFGTAASATSFTYLLAAGDSLELVNGNRYTGIITGIWASATGNARVTELTA